MPTVPQYDPQINPAQMPGSTVSNYTPPQAQSAADQLAQGLDTAGRAAEAMVLDKALRANTARLNESATAATKAQTELITEAQQRHGKNALELPDNQSLTEFYGQKMDDKLDEIRDSLSNPYQHEKFAQIASGIKLQLNDKLKRHVINEQDAYEQAQRTASVDLAKSRAVLFRADPEIMAQSTQVVQHAVAQSLKDAGLWSDKTIRKAAMSDALSSMYQDAITGLIDGGNIGLAQQYLKQYGGFMEGADVRDVQAVIAEVQQQATAAQAAQTLQANARQILIDHDGNLFQALTATDDPATRDAIESIYSDAQKRQEQVQDAAFDQAMKYIKAGEAIPPSVRAHLGDDEVDALLTNSVSWSRDVTNWRKWTAFTSLTPEQMAELSQRELYTQYGKYFDKGDWRDALGAWKEASSGDGEVPNTINLWTKGQVLDAAVRELGLDGGDGEITPEEQNRIDTFKGEFQKRINTRGVTTIADLRDLADDMVSEMVRIDSTFGDEKIPLYSMTEDQHESAYVMAQEGQRVFLSEIPRDFRVQVDKHERAMGRGTATVDDYALAWIKANQPEPAIGPGEVAGRDVPTFEVDND